MMSAFSNSDGPASTARGNALRYRRLGQLRHEALMLAMKGRHAEAAQVILNEVDLSDGEDLTQEERRLLSTAASYLQKSGNTDDAAAVFEAIGEGARAARSRSLPTGVGLLAPSGPPPESTQRASTATALSVNSKLPASGASQDGPPSSSRFFGAGDESSRAARELLQRGEHAAAAAKFVEAGLHYEAGICYVKAGAISEGLEQLVKVPVPSPHYMPAARTVIRLLTRLGQWSSQWDQYVEEFVRRGPTKTEDVVLFVRWSDLVRQQGAIDAANEIRRLASERFPNHEALSESWRRNSLEATSPTVWAASEPGTSPTLQAPPDSAEPPVSVRLSPVSSSRSRIESSSPAESSSRSRSDEGRLTPASRVARPSSVRISSMPPPNETPQSLSLAAGQVVGDRFRLEAEIGRGGMAIVFSARDLELDEEVALKVFSGQLVTQEWLDDAVARFRAELKVCRKLLHPNIIQVYDIGIHAGYRYFTMELLKGRGLHELLAQALEPTWVASCLIQVCAGLQAAHDKGVIHRDIKPENLFVTDEGVVKIMDFGIAKSRSQRSQTVLGQVGGTPEYMAPEQITGFSSVGPAADQYALGIVAYELLTGKVPFDHEEVMPLLMMHREKEPQPLRELNPDVPAVLEDIVLRMLAKDPAVRFDSCSELAVTLSAFVSAAEPSR